MSLTRWLYDSTVVRLPFDCSSTALQPLYVTAYLFLASALRPKY